MPDIGASSTLLLSQNVKLYADLGNTKAGSVASSADDKLTAMRVADFSLVHPMTRMNHGRRVDYGFAPPDIIMNAVFSGTSDILGPLIARCTQNDVGVIPSRIWKFEVKSIASTAVTKTIWADVIVYEVRGSKVDAHPGQAIDIEATMIVREPITGDGRDTLGLNVV